MLMTMDVVMGRHTEEIREKASEGIANFEFFVGELSEREKKIFEIAYANGYSDSNFDNEIGQEVSVLK